VRRVRRTLCQGSQGRLGRRDADSAQRGWCLSLHSILVSHGSPQTKRKAAGALDDDDGPKKRRRATKPKDPNAPKRPASSYILFQNEIRKELKEKHPHLTNPELLTMISEMWKKMSDEEKAVSFPPASRFHVS
jgi:hypothetical protein